MLDVGADGRVAALTYGALARALEPARQRACARAASGAATASRCCCRRARRCRSRMSRSTSSARWRCRSRPCSASTRSPIGCATPARRRSSPTPPGSRKLAAIADDLPDLAVVLSVDGPDGSAEGFARGARSAASPDFAPRRHRRRRPGDDDLHLRHDRPAEGRAARPPRAPRPSARRADAARVPAAAGRPALDAGRLGLGRRPPQRAPARPPFRRAGGGAEDRRSSIPRRRSG